MSYKLFDEISLNKMSKKTHIILIILIIVFIFNIIILSMTIINIVFIYKVTPLFDSLNNIRKHSLLNNETLIIDTINKLPHIINSLCKIITC